MKKFNFFITILLIALVVAIALNSKVFIGAALNGISAWAFNVLPCIFPFMIITKIIMSMGQVEKFCKPFSQPFSKLYGTSGSSAYVFFMSILAGYPVGSQMVASLYESGKIDKSEAYRMSSFCSNSGPMFIIGTVGCLLLKNAAVGGILFASHVLSALLNGLVYRKIRAHGDSQNAKENVQVLPATQSFGDIVGASVQAILNVGGIICFFFIIIEAFSPVLGLLPGTVRPLIEGLIELTRGCIDASSLPIYAASVMCSFLIGFGGFSTILQSMTMLKKLRMPVWLFSVMKFSQGLISAAITAVLMLAI